MQALEEWNRFQVPHRRIFGIIDPDKGWVKQPFIPPTLILAGKWHRNSEWTILVKDYKNIRECGVICPENSLYQIWRWRKSGVFATVFNTSIKRKIMIWLKEYLCADWAFKTRIGPENCQVEWSKISSELRVNSKPAVLFLDNQPGRSILMSYAKKFGNATKNLKKQGITILVSTPYMDEASPAKWSHWTDSKRQFPEPSTRRRKSLPVSGQNSWAAHKNMNKLLTDLRSNVDVKKQFAFGDSDSYYAERRLQNWAIDLNWSQRTYHPGIKNH